MTKQGKVLLLGNHHVVMCRLVVKENFLFRLLLRLLYFCKWSYETLLLQASSNKAIPCSCSTNEAKSSLRLSGVREEKGALLHPALDPTRRIISIKIITILIISIIIVNASFFERFRSVVDRHQDRHPCQHVLGTGEHALFCTSDSGQSGIFACFNHRGSAAHISDVIFDFQCLKAMKR